MLNTIMFVPTVIMAMLLLMRFESIHNTIVFLATSVTKTLDHNTSHLCTHSKGCVKMVQRHIWRDYENLADDVRYTPKCRELYNRRRSFLHSLLSFFGLYTQETRLMLDA